MGKMRALNALLPHPDIARVKGQVEAGCAGAKHHHAAALDHKAGDRKGLLARVLKHRIHILFAGNIPDCLAEFARLFRPFIIFGRVDSGHLAPAFEILAVDHAFRAQREHIITLGFVRNHADGIGAGCGNELHAKHAKTARSAPHQHIVARLQAVRIMAKQHAIGGGQGECVAGAFFP